MIAPRDLYIEFCQKYNIPICYKKLWGMPIFIQEWEQEKLRDEIKMYEIINAKRY